MPPCAPPAHSAIARVISSVRSDLRWFGRLFEPAQACKYHARYTAGETVRSMFNEGGVWTTAALSGPGTASKSAVPAGGASLSVLVVTKMKFFSAENFSLGNSGTTRLSDNFCALHPPHKGPLARFAPRRRSFVLLSTLSRGLTAPANVFEPRPKAFPRGGIFRTRRHRRWTPRSTRTTWTPRLTAITEGFNL